MTQITFEASVPALIADIEPLVLRLERRDRIPATAATTTISAGEYEEAAALHSLLLPISTSELARRFQNPAHRISYSHGLSLGLKLGPVPIGCSFVLSETCGGSAFFFAIMIAPEMRGKWAGPWLKYRTFCHLSDCGIHTLLFEAYKGNHDTIKHAHRVSARRLDVQPSWVG
ncbi:hypothetical protein [Hoeflea sp. EC-HK425]|uniref:hypothetical protein n=1 Tax=Hoeflea sp. EC-HK425 TaxID=2038388 RepID=UPI00125F15F4|nr:hypothetical protein [Hoeflea sp. EC-HK425]|tara:strand:- start:821 stop:1336 length:516 start_codon:yes stop_codon:yes gene_type:complete